MIQFPRLSSQKQHRRKKPPRQPRRPRSPLQRPRKPPPLRKPSPRPPLLLLSFLWNFSVLLVRRASHELQQQFMNSPFPYPGKILWGQLHTVIEGHRNADNSRFDSRKGPVALANTGTIMQSAFAYCVAARPGTWVAQRIKIKDEYQIGFIVHHADVDGLELIQKTRPVRFGQRDANKEVFYINRYDWVSFDSTSRILNFFRLQILMFILGIPPWKWRGRH